MARICPKCKSEDVKVYDYLGIKCVMCNQCGYDEAMEYEVYGEGRSSQKAKGRFTPYKVGGARRTQK